ncbi:hypothetical protein [Burkholderia diffusa]|uniref:hypothetical protein n=1 Tax=Burkholderia diffusa TaxID=488732 RepID=UPI00157B4063|nr:hypothetical protein [Burkholderia diffusa]
MTTALAALAPAGCCRLHAVHRMSVALIRFGCRRRPLPFDARRWLNLQYAQRVPQIKKPARRPVSSYRMP